jgi:hypothetical protein
MTNLAKSQQKIMKEPPPPAQQENQTRDYDSYGDMLADEMAQEGGSGLVADEQENQCDDDDEYQGDEYSNQYEVIEYDEEIEEDEVDEFGLRDGEGPIQGIALNSQTKDLSTGNITRESTTLYLHGKTPTDRLISLLKLARKSKNAKVKKLVIELNRAVRAATVKFVGWNIGLVNFDYWFDTVPALISTVKSMGGEFIMDRILQLPPVKVIIDRIIEEVMEESKRKFNAK